MQQTTKLTLSIPRRLLREAKRYSHRARQPLSRLVSHYFRQLASARVTDPVATTITPTVRKITGIVRGTHDDDDAKLLTDALVARYVR